MSYLQITTKCNMTCEHCCYSCGPKGRHGSYEQIIENIRFIHSELDEEYITIGGGEPTLHPRFFDILRYCLDKFEYVWMATNGSQTNTMYRLANIIDGNDYEYTDHDEEIEDYVEEPIYLRHNNHLQVALSQDYFHDEIDSKVVDLWKKSKYEIRDVSRTVINNGRAGRTGAANTYGCVCSDKIIKIDGSIRMCGCERSPCYRDCSKRYRTKMVGLYGNS